MYMETERDYLFNNSKKLNKKTLEEIYLLEKPEDVGHKIVFCTQIFLQHIT